MVRERLGSLSNKDKLNVRHIRYVEFQEKNLSVIFRSASQNRCLELHVALSIGLRVA